MEYVLFGRTGMRVSPLCLGTMTFGKEADEAASVAIMERAWAAGINFFDTANVYSRGVSEDIVGRWIGGRRDALVLASKVHFPMGDGPNERGSSRRHILLSVEQSLKRLRTDRLDLLYLHHWDEETALDQSFEAVTDLVRQGKVVYCGVSNFAAWQTMKALGVAAARGCAPVVCVQPMYNLVKRQAEVEILPMARSEGLAVCPYNPLGGGLLTGKYEAGGMGRLAENEMYRDRYKHPQYAEVTRRFVAYARARGLSPAALALAWVTQHPDVTSTILGARNMAQFEDNLRCLDIRLTTEERAEVTALSVAPPMATDR